jgi:hypothetical protein
MKKLYTVSLLLLLSVVANAQSVAKTAALPAFTSPGTVELGGDLSYASQKNENAASSDNSASTFLLNAYVGVMVVSGFELGIRPGIQLQSFGNQKLSSVNILFAPAYNINGGSTIFPYFEFLVGYNSMRYEIDDLPFQDDIDQTASGAAIGIDGGFKALVGNSGLILFKIEYLHQTYKTEAPFASETNFGTLSAGVGFRVFFSGSPSKTK